MLFQYIFKLEQFMNYKIVILGSSGVGKTSILQVKSEGSMSSTLSTITPQYISYSEIINNVECTISIWDTPGQYNFRNTVKNFIRNSTCIIYTFSLSQRDSFEDLDGWLNFVNENEKPTFTILVGNKCDLERSVETNEANENEINSNIDTSTNENENREDDNPVVVDKNKGNSSNKFMIIYSVVNAVLLICIIIALVFIYYKYKKLTQNNQEEIPQVNVIETQVESNKEEVDDEMDQNLRFWL